MELTEKHIENLQAMAETEGIRRDQLPHPQHVRFLVKYDFADIIGETWIAQANLTDKGRRALKELGNEV
jgi:hypothetical protein